LSEDAGMFQPEAEVDNSESSVHVWPQRRAPNPGGPQIIRYIHAASQMGFSDRDNCLVMVVRHVMRREVWKQVSGSVSPA
jgi:hypothetical protein